MLSFLGPIISLVSEPVKSYMQERTIKAENKVKVEQAKVNAQIRQIERTAESEINYDIENVHLMNFAFYWIIPSLDTRICNVRMGICSKCTRVV